MAAGVSAAALRRSMLESHSERLDEMNRANHAGQLYLKLAGQYKSQDDCWNALMCVMEGLALSAGPFYLAVRDQLKELERILLLDLELKLGINPSF